jgi:hypothetical protein
MKTAVYSWRLTPEERAALEHEARQEKVSMAVLLSRITQSWLAERRRQARDDEQAQALLQATAQKTFGTVKGGNPDRSVKAKDAIRQRIKARHDR